MLSPSICVRLPDLAAYGLPGWTLEFSTLGVSETSDSIQKAYLTVADARYGDNFLVVAHPHDNIVENFEFQEEIVDEEPIEFLRYQENTGLWKDLPDSSSGDHITSILTILPSVDIDSDSDKTGIVDESDREEVIERSDDYPDKVILLNNDDDNSNGTPDDPATTGTLVARTGQVSLIYGFTGQETDAESDLMFYDARYYDPRLGRFVSEDPIGFTALDTNLYRYTANNPINYVDPTGHGKITVIIKIGGKIKKVMSKLDPDDIKGMLKARTKDATRPKTEASHAMLKLEDGLPTGENRRLDNFFRADERAARRPSWNILASCISWDNWNPRRRARFSVPSFAARSANAW